MAQARGFFERALALDPGNIEALVGTAMVDSLVGGSFLWMIVLRALQRLKRP